MTSEVHRQVSENEQSQSIWIRGLFMLLFVLIYAVAEAVLAAIAVVQFGWVAVTEDRNPRLAKFGASLSRFLYEMMRFWTFNTEEKPFPFAEWPSSPDQPIGGNE